MKVIQVTREQNGLEKLILAMEAIIEYSEREYVLDIRVGIDDSDSGLKFSVNGMSWSPPIHGELS